MTGTPAEQAESNGDDRSERIAEALFGGGDQAKLEQGDNRRGIDGAYETAAGIYISDVAEHARRFHLAAAFFSEIGEDMPCISIGEFGYAPVEVFGGGYPFAWSGWNPYYFDEAYYFWRRAYRRGYVTERLKHVIGEKGDVRLAPPEETRGFIRSGVSRFLRSRFAAAKSLTSYKPVPFTLHNQNPNLQMYYSSPYYFVTTNVFGGPSTPVTQYIHPGIYIFGGMGPKTGNLPIFETISHFDIPRIHTSGTLVTV
jgi:hypothetical protein